MFLFFCDSLQLGLGEGNGYESLYFVNYFFNIILPFIAAQKFSQESILEYLKNTSFAPVLSRPDVCKINPYPANVENMVSS